MIVHTAIHGGYDQLKPHPDHPDVDRWICHTDDSRLSCDGWETIVEMSPSRHPRLAAKWRKCHPPDTDCSIWIDGSISLTADWIDAAVAALDDADMFLHRHPDRTSILAEAEVSATMTKYAGLPVLAQAHHYIDNWGYPDVGLWAAGMIARRHTPTVLQMGAAWFAECEHWTYQDQISLPPLLARYNIEPAAADGSIWDHVAGVHAHHH